MSEYYHGISLCWYCRNSVPSNTTGAGCSWSRQFKPVDGWTAVEKKQMSLHSAGYSVTTYHVIKCPEFDRDVEEGQLSCSKDDKIWLKALMELNKA